MAASPETSVSGVARLADTIRASVAESIVGRDAAVELAIVALLAAGHVLIEDLPGTGKTTLCKALASALQMSFARMQFTPDLMPADLVGVNVYDPGTREFSFKPGPIFTNVLLADEINRATPRAQSALLESMQEAQVSIDGVTRALPSPFMVFATQNPLEMEGTFPLPEAQLDRFLIRFAIGLPSRDEEARMLERLRDPGARSGSRVAADASQLEAARAAVRGVAVTETVRDYTLDLVTATRSDPRLRAGASPRATLALERASQARAALRARDFVAPDDVKAVAEAVLAHRLVVEPSQSMRDVTASDITAELLTRVPVPIGE